MTADYILDFYRQPVDLSALGAHAAKVANLPRDPAGLAKVVQGLLIHEHMGGMYGVAFTPQQHAEAHVRPIETLLGALDSRPLTEARPAGERFVCVCRSFALLFVAVMRHHGTPARARCGFGAYFEKGKFIDHWVAEYWNGERWVMVDAQIDERQRRQFGITTDTLDVKRDEFVIAGDGWRRTRSGELDPKTFGVLDMWGAWFIASNLIRDVAALNNREMLPWDVWGAMTQDDSALDRAFLDRLAILTHDPDRHFDALREVYLDPRIAVPRTVFNAVHNRAEAA
ncbi:MAG TPA: transglutaminase domain-containing protein [Reyranellaceae bacterium]|nr:transglutaminase domain-containing protein [Reyranellaceae bacterium]